MSQMSLDLALRQAMQLGRAGKEDAASRILDSILASDPGQPDALQLKGMLARAGGAHEQAARLFRHSLSRRPAQPHVLNNLGNSLVDLGQVDEAIACYRQALRIDPGFGDAGNNLALALLRQGKPAEACELLRKRVDAAPGDAKAWGIYGQALRSEGRFPEAIAAFRKSLKLGPDRLAVRHNLAVALRLAGQPDEALALLRQCAAEDPDSAEISYNIGHCLQELGELPAAADAYRAALRIQPANRDAHASLSRLLWQMGDEAGFLDAYGAAISRHPDDAGLLADYGYQLVLADRPDEAATMIEAAIGRGVDGPELRFRLGQACWNQGRADETLAQFSAGLGLDPDHRALRRETARILIILGRYPQALELLGDEEIDQQAIAYRGLCWRFLGNRKALSLNDYGGLVRASILVPPADQGDIGHFNRRLAERLGECHAMAAHPLEQSLRGGTQTVGNLFDRDIPELVVLREMIEAEIRAYLDALPDDPDHPFLRRKSTGFDLSGSWSVRLRRAGFHMNHVHPEGWISSCYYVETPKAVDHAPGHQGWLKFGETPLHLGDREEVGRLIRPEVGKLVLFPSYFYHGTIPFEEDGWRTTIAFDVVPVPEPPAGRGGEIRT